jgi:hypothetical protein
MTTPESQGLIDAHRLHFPPSTIVNVEINNMTEEWTGQKWNDYVDSAKEGGYPVIAQILNTHYLADLTTTPAAPAVPEPAAPAPDDSPPEPMIEGSFALYQHKGGFLIAWRKKGEQDVRHLPIPEFVLQMAAGAAGRPVDELITDLIEMASK